MNSKSKYFGKYMDNETYCEGQKPFIHMHLDNIIREVASEFNLTDNYDYSITFSEFGVNLTLTISGTIFVDDVNKFILSVTEKLKKLADDRYPIVFDQPEANRLHDFFITVIKAIDKYTLSKSSNGDYYLNIECQY